MKPKTAQLWSEQDRHEGDRWRLFRAVAEAVNAQTVLHPGCYVDIAPSFVFESVTYVDLDKRAPEFFDDIDGVRGSLQTATAPAMASIDPRCQLRGVVVSQSGSYRFDTTDLASYLIPKKPQTITADALYESGRGIAYSKAPFACLFERIA